MVHPIFLKPGADGKVDQERLHPDGILMSGDRKVFIEFSRCPESLASERIKIKVNKEVAKSHNAEYCVIILTKQEGEIFEEGSISIFDEYGKQSAKTRFTRERTTFDEHHRFEDDAYAKVTTEASLCYNTISRTSLTTILIFVYQSSSIYNTSILRLQ